MSKHDALKQERERVRKASVANAKPILRLTKVEGVYHVIGCTTTGKTFHEKFHTAEEAMEFASTISEV